MIFIKFIIIYDLSLILVFFLVNIVDTRCYLNNYEKMKKITIFNNSNNDDYL